MNAADVFNYSIPFLQALAPAVLVTAVIANGQLLVQFLVDLIRGYGHVK